MSDIRAASLNEVQTKKTTNFNPDANTTSADDVVQGRHFQFEGIK
jgi:hypothetical protein